MQEYSPLYYRGFDEVTMNLLMLIFGFPESWKKEFFDINSNNWDHKQNNFLTRNLISVSRVTCGDTHHNNIEDLMMKESLFNDYVLLS